VEGDAVYGAYGHIDGDELSNSDRDHGYFVFDTRTGQVTNFQTLEQLETAAGHRLNLVESEMFRSNEPARIWLRRVEGAILYGPPSAAFLLFIVLLLRKRVTSSY
jgi:hypothetical protein